VGVEHGGERSVWNASTGCPTPPTRPSPGRLHVTGHTGRTCVSRNAS
jgi:hypothetical protein